MKSARLPEGGKAWFVRKGKASHCSLTPASVEGHLLTAFYVVWIGALVWLVLGEDPGVARVVAFIAVVLASSLLYVLTAWRMSARAPASEKERRKCS